MIIPVRCFTCGKVLANKWKTYQARLAARDNELAGDDTDADAGTTSLPPTFDPKTRGQVLEELGIRKLCCKRHMLAHVDIIDYI